MATAAKITGQITRWWWVRHAPVPNPEARCYGQTDKDCDVTNHALFEHQARLLPKGAVWYASNLLRARKTAETLASHGGDMRELLIDPNLAEQHFGEWQGLTYVEIAEKEYSPPTRTSLPDRCRVAKPWPSAAVTIGCDATSEVLEGKKISWHSASPQLLMNPRSASWS